MIEQACTPYGVIESWRLRLKADDILFHLGAFPRSMEASASGITINHLSIHEEGWFLYFWGSFVSNYKTFVFCHVRIHR